MERLGSLEQIGRYVLGAIIGFILALITFQLYPRIQTSADEYLLQFKAHCQVGENQSFTRLMIENSNGDIVSNVVLVDDASKCSSSGFAAYTSTTKDITGVFTTNAAYTAEELEGLTIIDGREEVDIIGDITGSATQAVTVKAVTTPLAANAGITLSGNQAFVAGNLQVDGAAWTQQLPVTDFLSGISRLVIRLYPILAAVGFLGMSATGMFQFAQGGSVTRLGLMIGGALAGLISIIVIFALAPAFLEGLNDAYLWSDPDRLDIMGGFGNLPQTIIRFVALLFSASILGIIAGQGWMAYRNVRQSF